MPPNHLILCHLLLLLPSVFPSISVFSNELILPIRDQIIGASTSASVLPMNIQGWFPLGLTGLISLLSKGLSRVFSSITIQKHQFFCAQSFWGQHHYQPNTINKIPVNSKKQESSKKTSTSALLTMPKLLTVWTTTNSGKFLKTWEYQTTCPNCWEICMQVRKQQLELDMEKQTGSKSGKEYVKAVYCHLLI